MEAEVCPWLTQGAPAGITQMPLAAGIFPGIQGEDPEPYGLLHIDLESFSNYPGIDTDVEEIDAHVAAGHLFATYSIDEVREQLGEKNQYSIRSAS